MNVSWLSRGLFTAHKGTQEEGGVKADRKGEKTAGKRGRKAFFSSGTADHALRLDPYKRGREKPQPHNQPTGNG